jgi:hypothetical protein
MSKRSFRRVQIGAAAALVAALVGAGSVAHAASSKADSTSFELFPNAKFVDCLAGPYGQPKVEATVRRGELNDTMQLKLTGFKPGLQFDLFTVENSPQLADGSANPEFNNNFGLAWYQSDVEVGDNGSGEVRIKTILLDQIFGFDAGAGLAPTNTFHVGFWFNNPDDAAPCGFTGVTPFNGEHQAGPLAFITRPDANTTLGPLCTDPDGAGHCNP